MRAQFDISFDEIISLDNLLAAWREFSRGKRHKPDVDRFGSRLMDNLIELHEDLVADRYEHGDYYHFAISDPKPRQIHKATVRDRVLNRAIYRRLYPLFDRTFISDSFSCRNGKGTHLAMSRFREITGQVSRNNAKTCWVLKCDIRKFFANIDHDILMQILAEYLTDRRLLGLLDQLVRSFETKPSCGLPLGNLTSQLLVNVYMNEFDQFVKHGLRAKHYVRYADDFVLMSRDKSELEMRLGLIRQFLSDRLALDLHPHKVSITTLASGVDFLGWVHFPDHLVLRTTTRRRMERKINDSLYPGAVVSYQGMLKYGNAHNLADEIVNAAWLVSSDSPSSSTQSLAR
jgi:retron-type reverse transcriptase